MYQLNLGSKNISVQVGIASFVTNRNNCADIRLVTQTSCAVTKLDLQFFTTDISHFLFNQELLTYLPISLITTIGLLILLTGCRMAPFQNQGVLAVAAVVPQFRRPVNG